ncbi:MAG: 4Fe-4S binding protein [Chloroflexota bacterium]|nr:4Fe-4S binding protein [Chloroflexota bacterium]
MNWLLSLLQSIGRPRIQIAAALLQNAYFFPWMKRVPCTTLNCHACPAATFACPVGIIQGFETSRQVPFFVLGILGIVAIVIGRMSCGWFCPFGFLQDLMYRIRTPKLTVKYNLGWFRYVVLIGLVGIATFIAQDLWFCKLCPAGSLEAGIPVIATDPLLRSQIGSFFWLKMSILAVFLGLMIIIKRPFCRFVCPLGAIYSPFNSHSVLQLKVNDSLCIDCGRCREVCPMDMNIKVNSSSGECIRCLECAKICPVSAIGYDETV